MNKFKVGYYQADTVNGVTYYNDIMDNPTVEIITIQDFIDSLDTLDESETIFTFIDHHEERFFDEIVKDYGIN